MAGDVPGVIKTESDLYAEDVCGSGAEEQQNVKELELRTEKENACVLRYTSKDLEV